MSRNKLRELHALGTLRSRTKCKGYRSLADFPGRVPASRFVSPYSHGAMNVQSRVFVMLQDWVSARYLSRRPASELLTLGRDPGLPTNRRLEDLLYRHFEMNLSDVFATNLFPYIKPKRMQGTLPFDDLVCAARMFGLPQIMIVAPRLVICLGLATFNALRVAGGLPRVVTLDEASRSHFALRKTRIWCQAHTGARGQHNRGRSVADGDWSRMARWYYRNDA